MGFLLLLAFVSCAAAAAEEVPVFTNTGILPMDAEAYDISRVASKYGFSSKKKVRFNYGKIIVSNCVGILQES